MATVREDVLQVRVRDDGRGGADFGRGSGLSGLKDRIEALGGRISLHSPPGAGTTLQIALPLSGLSRFVAESPWPGPAFALARCIRCLILLGPCCHTRGWANVWTDSRRTWPSAGWTAARWTGYRP